MESLDSLQSGLASGRLAGCTSLKLSDGLTEFPQAILALADSLTFLNLSDNHLSELPPEFSQLTQLKIVFFNNNNFEAFPTVLAQCPQLSMVSFKNNRIKTIEPQALSPTVRWLILTNNQLTALPTTIGQLSKLQKLMLAGNQLSSIPSALANCQNLELIRLSANRLAALPTWLLSMPRIAWLAYAGNPCHPAHTASPDEKPLPTIKNTDLQQQKVLGEGASGIIYKGIWTPSDRLEKEPSEGNPSADSRAPLQTPSPSASKTTVSKTSTSKTLEVAIKHFKGDITSDGSPLDEMQACIAAGTHPNLVNVLGKYRHADNKGLIFTFIPSTYKNLGNPPSLETCTRDTYPPETTFTLAEVISIATGIASAAQHLHSCNMMHGDLYAHNILINPAGHSILGDFGAASFYDVAIVGQSLEKIEVRAFGCLLEDLLEHCSLNDGSLESSGLKDPIAASEEGMLRILRQLQKVCTQTKPLERPVFSQISTILKAATEEHQKP